VGIPCAQFLAPNYFRARFQINFRNHRKLLIVDGETAITGGRNFSGEYFDDGPSGFRDLSILVRGPAVGALKNVFLEDWIVATEGPDRELSDLAIPPPRGQTDLRVIPHGCDEQCDAFVPIVSAALRSAEKSIVIVTPYFVPGATMLHDLRLAALAGIQVRILIPERSPERWPEVAARRFFEPLLAAGVEIWIRPPPFMHAKAIVVDERWTVVGSANFDQRSFYLNYELSCEIPSPEFARAIGDFFAPDFAVSRRLDPAEFARRGWGHRVVENAAALFAPVL
jgi:cardiolipin synthase